MSSFWIVVLCLGAIALIAVAFASIARNRRRRRGTVGTDIGRTEQATHRLYEQEDAADHARDNRVER